MKNLLKRYAVALAVAVTLTVGGLAIVEPPQAFAQARASLTNGAVVTIRSILSGTLTGASGTSLSFPTITATSGFLAPTGCPTGYNFSAETTLGLCRRTSGVGQFTGTLEVDALVMDTTNRDIRQRRTGPKTLTVDDGAGGALTDFAVTGPIDASTNVTGANLRTASGTGQIYFLGRSVTQSSADGRWAVSENAGSFGFEISAAKTAAPTLTTCGTGTIASTSRNSGGTVTATGATACTVVFSSGVTFTNTPHCVATDGTGARALWINSASTTGFTVNGLTAGDVFTYHCFGGS